MTCKIQCQKEHFSSIFSIASLQPLSDVNFIFKTWCVEGVQVAPYFQTLSILFITLSNVTTLIYLVSIFFLIKKIIKIFESIRLFISYFCRSLVACYLYSVTLKFIIIYTTAERVTITQDIYENQQSANSTAQLFNDQHENRHVNRKYVLELVTEFRETSSVKNKKRQ